jgi:1-acyl-sn-glycerol-3-phosphate acyltransferase
MARPVVLGGISLLSAARGFGWREEGIERILELEEPIVFAANHCSHADTAAILGTLPPRLRARTCVAAALDVFGRAGTRETRRRILKREVLQIVVAAGFHAFAFDRHGPPLRSLRTATSLVRHGWNLLLYPEGTRSRSVDLGPFKAGVGVIAKMTGRPVVPVHVSGGQSILPCRASMPRPGCALVRYGEPMRHRDGESPVDFAARVRLRVAALATDAEIETKPVTVLRPDRARV